MKNTITFLLCLFILLPFLPQSFATTAISSDLELKENASLQLSDELSARNAMSENACTLLATGTGSSIFAAYNQARFYLGLRASNCCSNSSPLVIVIHSTNYRYDRRIGWVCTISFTVQCQ